MYDAYFIVWPGKRCPAKWCM